MKKIAVLFRNDLRTHDHKALYKASIEGQVIPIYVKEQGLGAAFSYWTHLHLQSHSEKIETLGGKLYYSEKNLLETVEEILPQVDAIYFHRSYHPDHFSRDVQLEKCHEKIRSFEGTLLHSPWENVKHDGTPYKVFTPFYKNARTQTVPTALPFTANATFTQINFPSFITDDLNRLQFEPKLPWKDGIRNAWEVGEDAAIQFLKNFGKTKLPQYKNNRDFPAIDGASSISPYLAVGALSVRSAYHYMQNKYENITEPFIRQLFWREFAYHVLYHFPATLNEPLNDTFKKFPWQKNDVFLRTWQKGETGIPLIDAGMKQLWATGFMHNRVRMNVASYLTKHLLIDYREGAAWFWDTLIDADIANNTFGWQWAAGCGADAAPYFRIFNPYLQADKFDGNKRYIDEWRDEITLSPIVSHEEGRAKALAAYKTLKNTEEI